MKESFCSNVSIITWRWHLNFNDTFSGLVCFADKISKIWKIILKKLQLKQAWSWKSFQGFLFKLQFLSHFLMGITWHAHEVEQDPKSVSQIKRRNIMEWMFPLLSDYTSSFYLRHCFVTIVKLRLVGILSLLREITLVHTDKDWINTMSSLWKLIQKWTKWERNTPMETTSTAKLLWIYIFQLSWNRCLIQFGLQMVGFQFLKNKIFV